MIVTAEIFSPVFGFVVEQDRDRAFHQDPGVHFAAKAVSAAGGRADGQDYAAFANLGNRRESPVDPRTHQKPSPYGKLVERYLSFGRYHFGF